MDLKEAVAIAKRQVSDQFADEAPHNLRLEEYLYDDHLGVWSLTIGFVLGGGEAAAGAKRSFKLVRVSQADQSVLSIRDP